MFHLKIVEKGVPAVVHGLRIQLQWPGFDFQPGTVG